MVLIGRLTSINRTYRLDTEKVGFFNMMSCKAFSGLVRGEHTRFAFLLILMVSIGSFNFNPSYFSYMAFDFPLPTHLEISLLGTASI